MFSAAKPKLIAVVVVLLALWILPAPILPPHRLAEAAQSRAWDQLEGGLPRSRGFSIGDLAAERSLFNAQLSYAQTQGVIFQSLVNVYKAMGGGWVVEADKMTGQGNN